MNLPPLLPPGIGEWEWEAESKPHSLELPLSLQWGNFDSPEIWGQAFVSEATEVASGVGKPGPWWESLS